MDKKYSSGILMGIAGVLLFSTKAVIVKLMYQYDVDAMGALLLRMGFALPIYLFFLFLDRKALFTVSKKDFLIILLMGFLGYYMASLWDFKGLELIDASLERLILFVYPTFVVLMSRFFLKQPITKKQLAAILITYVGVIIIFLPKVLGKSDETTLQNIEGATYIILSAICYAMFLTWSQNVMGRVPVRLFTSLALIVSSFCMLIHFSFTTDLSVFHKPAGLYIYGAIMAVFATVIPSYLISASISRVGAGTTAILGAMGPVSTITLAILFLNERLTLLQVLGAAVILIGVMQVKRK